MREALVVLAVLFGLVLAVLWVLLPFAVFAIRRSMRDAHSELVRLREAVERQAPR